MRKTLAVLAFAAASLFSAPAFAAAPVCSGSYDYYGYRGPDDVAIGFFPNEYCYDPDGGDVYFVSMQGVYSSGNTAFVRNSETPTVYVSDADGNITAFSWQINLYY